MVSSRTNSSKELLNLKSEEDPISSRLIVNPKSDPTGETSNNAISELIVPKPGFCLKTHNADKTKVFINICCGENLPEPRQISDEELLRIINSDDVSSFRVPMSLGIPHVELDKSGKACSVFDVVINPNFLTRLNSSEILIGFFLTLVLEGLEEKYELILERDWKILKNRKFFGSLPEQNIRLKSKPMIVEQDSYSAGKNNEISSRKIPEPAYTLIQEPPKGYPEFLIAEIHLPKVKSSASLQLDLGEDHIVLETRSNSYKLDIFIPYFVVPDESGCQFDTTSKILTITMPVQADNSALH